MSLGVEPQETEAWEYCITKKSNEAFFGLLLLLILGVVLVSFLCFVFTFWPTSKLKIKFIIHSFIWLHSVLDAAVGIFDLGYIMQDL